MPSSPRLRRGRARIVDGTPSANLQQRQTDCRQTGIAPARKLARVDDKQSRRARVCRRSSEELAPEACHWSFNHERDIGLSGRYHRTATAKNAVLSVVKWISSTAEVVSMISSQFRSATLIDLLYSDRGLLLFQDRF